MSDEELKAIEQQVAGKRNFESPPLHLWQPALSGDIPIRIAADGTWYHEGARIERDALVRLFASILRREEDGEYYLVTPVEKWRLEVELHPLIVTDIDRLEEGGTEVLVASLNTGRRFTIGTQHELFLEPSVGMIAAMQLPHGLSALFSRAAWYRLVDLAQQVDGRSLVRSADYEFDLSAAG